MKHVRLNASSRSRLVVAIRKEAEKQWLDAPAGRRMLELEDEMENAIAEQQAIAVPYADREVLARYGVGWTDTETARFVRTDTGVIRPNSFRLSCAHEFTPAVYKINSRVVMGNGSAYDESDWLKDNRREELAEWFHLRETFTCEINKLVQAWETLIGMHTTTRTLFEQHPELVRFAGIVKVTPPPADPTGAIAAAEATVKAFGALG